jgi:uncharacterized membrane protein
MAHIHETIEIDAPADEVWDLAGDPARISEWVPALADSTVEGDRRSCTTGEGAAIEERILERSDDGRYYTYEILGGPLPLSSYRSRLSVAGHGDHSHVDWEANLEPNNPGQEVELTEVFGGIYRQGLESLRERFEGRAAA